MTNLKLFTRTSFTLICISFLVLVSACGDDEESPEVSIQPVETELKYEGEWNGNLGFSQVAISAKVEESSVGNFAGDLYISSNYTSCCASGESDGKFTYNVMDSNITNFRWTDVIPGCTGLFIGSGTVKVNGDLEINITGTDCDGDHIATLTLEKR